MATYTQIDNTEINTMLSHYDLGSFVSLQALKGGQANSSFKLETQRGAFVISICDEKSMADVTTLTHVLDLLEKNDFPTTRVVKTTDNRSVVQLKGKPVFVKTYIHGRVPERTSTAMIFQVGRQLARLHRIPPPADVPGQFAYGLESFDEVINAKTNHGYRQWLSAKKDYLQGAISDDLPQNLIHGDLFYDNTLFIDKDRKSVV